ncbi:hypothetical protein ACQKJG_27510 [Priestia megaterium]|uniref:hypothetical protein n=1 Tax=Priestia megaterium TaxID=1404 RepID=UPI003D07C55C
MMFYGPLLYSLIPGSFCLFFTYKLRQQELSLAGRLVPAALTIVIASYSFYIGYVEIRGFEGAAYLFFSFFLFAFAAVSVTIARKSLSDSLNRYMIQGIRHFFFIVLSTCLVFFSILTPTRINDEEEYRNAYFGLPVPFVKQDLPGSGCNYLGGFPHWLTIQTPSMENAAKFEFHYARLALSVILTYLFLMILRHYVKKLN